MRKNIRFQTRELCSNWRSILDIRHKMAGFKFQVSGFNLQKFIISFILFPLWGLGGLGLGGLGSCLAQVFPVQMTPVFSSPYSSKISDYATSLDTRFQLIVNPTDVNINSRQVRLKMYISGNGIEAQTSEFATGINPIFINGGEIQTLTNVDLAGYFRLENLQGLSNVQYANPLPEGSYSFCFEMYDFVTNQKISRKSCANLYLILNDPPILNIPARNEQIVVSVFPNILFTWTPRSINATNVSYRFELKLLQDPSLDPQFGFAISPTVLDETQFGTTLLYNTSKPVLIPGKRYAWRVRAISTGGLSENSVFKNDGYSEIFWFTYASNCPAPMMVFSEIVGSKSVKITWQSNIQNTKYQVQYRKRTSPNPSQGGGFEWFSTYTLNTQTTITDLDVATDYEFRVGATCEPTADPSVPYTFSGINNFSTPAAGATTTSAYSCGLNPAIAIANQTPITNLIVSETFTAGDFPVKILELTGSSPYSGKGFIIVPYLSDTRIAVEFNNITVNTSYQLINGVVQTTYNPSWNNVSDVEDLTGEGEGGQVEHNVPFVIGGVGNITINAAGDIVINGPNNQQITIPGGKDVVITDSAGNVYNVDNQGNVSGPFSPAAGGAPTPANTDGVNASGQATAFSATGVKVVFKDFTGSKYAFDDISTATNAPDYIKSEYKKVGNDYLIYKAVVNQQTDFVTAKVDIAPNATINLNEIVFKTQRGALVPSVRIGTTNEYKLTVTGTQTYADEEILATIKQGEKYKVAGAFKLVHISAKDLNVVLVPMNNKNIPNTEITKIKDIYKKAGVNVNVTIGTNKITETGGDDHKIEVGNSNILSIYTNEQKEINKKVKLLSGYNQTTYYMVYSNLQPSKPEIKGFMALSGQFGYVFPSDDAYVAAHELGHGALGLEHPFKTDADQGKTNFLMDYSVKNELWHKDWKQINDPKFRLYNFQGDSEGESYTIGFIPDNWKNKSNDDSVSFLTPAKSIVVLPKETIKAYFSFGIGDVNSCKNCPAGTLHSFVIKIGNVEKVYKLDVQNMSFKGYKNGNEYFTNYKTITNNDDLGKVVYRLLDNEGVTYYKLKNTQYQYYTSGTQPRINIFAEPDVDLNSSEWIRLNSIKYGNIDTGLSSTLMNQNYVSTLEAIEDKNKEALIVSKIYEYRCAYPAIYDRMTNHFGNWTFLNTVLPIRLTQISNLTNGTAIINYLMGIPKEQMEFGYFDSEYVKNDWNSTITTKVGKLIKFLLVFQEAINFYQGANSSLISTLTSATSCELNNSVWLGGSNLTAIQIVNAVVAMSPEQLMSICTKKRTQAISEVLSTWIVSEIYESAIYRLMTTCPDNKLNEFFELLRNFKYPSSNEHILGMIARRIDDTTLFVGSNLNTQVMNFFASGYQKLIASKTGSIYDTYIKKAVELQPNQFDDYVKERTVTYNYTSFGKRLFKSIVNSQTYGFHTMDNDVKSVVEYSESTGKLSYKNQAVNGFSYVGNTYNNKTFDPWEPLVIDVKGNLVNIYSTEADGNQKLTQFLPAYLLYFAEKKADSQTTQAAIQTAVDAITLVIPGAQGTQLLRLLNYADKASSVASILGTVVGEDCPKCATVLNITSGILGVTNLVGTTYANKLAKIESATEAAKTLADAAKLDAAKMTAIAHEAEIVSLTDKITDVTPSQPVIDIMTDASAKRRLVDILKIEKDAAIIAGKNTLVTKINSAINKLKAITAAYATNNFYIRFADKLSEYWTNAVIFSKKTNIASPQIAHFDAAGKLKIDKIDNVTDLADNSKLVDVADDAYIPNPNTPSVKEDVLVFKDPDGTLHCLTGTNCFTANTIVATKTGQKLIQNITENEMVLSYNEDTHKTTWQKVTHVFSKTAKSLQKLVVGKDTIFATPEHKFYTAKGWLQASTLAAGILVQTNSGFAEVKNNIALDSTATVYNFTVENNHTYFVGREKLLVHNDCKKLAKVLDDLGDKSDELVTFLKTVPVSRHPKILEAVEMLQSKIGKTTQFAVDPATLNKLADLMTSSSAFRTKLGATWKTSLEEILKTAKMSPCNTCGTAAGISIGRSPMNEYLENVDYFVNNININTKGEGMFNWMRGKTYTGSEPIANQLDELHQTLEVLKRDGITNSDLVDLGKQFTDGTKKFDIRLSDNYFIELKNKVYTNIGITFQDFDQVINGYFKNITNIDKFKWELKLSKNKSVWSTKAIAEEQMKIKWKTIFTANKENVFNAMRPELQQSLLLDTFSDLTSAKIDEIVNAFVKVK